LLNPFPPVSLNDEQVLSVTGPFRILSMTGHQERFHCVLNAAVRPHARIVIRIKDLIEEIYAAYAIYGQKCHRQAKKKF
jgi:hypothetical protein